MMGHKICFNGELWLIMRKLLLLRLLICSTVSGGKHLKEKIIVPICTCTYYFLHEPGLCRLESKQEVTRVTSFYRKMKKKSWVFTQTT